jgi:two-component system, LytTR family, sensor kinase
MSASFQTSKRFQFWRVFWIVMAVYSLFTVIGVVAMYVSPATNVPLNWEKLYTWRNIASQLLSFLFYSVFYYATLNLFYSRIAARKNWYNYAKPVGVAFFLMGLYFAASYFLVGKTSLKISVDGRLQDQLTPGVFLFGFAIASLFCTGFSFLIAYLVFLRDERKQRKVLEEQKMQLEVEKSQANLSFLKAQINPHFLHNTLNFLYAKSLPYSTELSEGILTLSDIMRYALGPAARDGKVALKEEIEHVRNVIKINQLRYSNNLNVAFDVNGVVNGATVVPFVLITLVENAFKHGDFKSAEHPIEIRLDVGNGRMRFFCRNKKKSGPKEISTGIGLDNIKKQLDLTYGKAYRFEVKDEAEFYTTDLTIHAI